MNERPRGRELRPGETLLPDEDCWDDETDEDEASSLLDSALALAAAGLPVFPCNADKRPAIPKAKGGNGFHDASTDPTRIRELWRLAGPAAQLIGVPTGGASGLDVLDLDSRHGSDTWLAANIHRLPETRIHGTPGLPKVPTDPVMPGEHWLFRHVDGVRNGASKLAPGIDVRGGGGYVCFPPSPGYRVIHEADIAEWPDWLLPLVLKTSEPAPRPEPSSYATPAKVSDNRLRGFIDREVRRVRDAPQGGRHGARLAAARSIGGVAAEAGLSDTEVEEMLIAARPPEVEEEKERRTVRDGLIYGHAAPIDLNTLPDSALFRGYRPHRGNGAAPPPDAPETGPSDGEAEPEGTQPEAGRELYGPPTLDDLDIADLAALDELVYGQIAKAKAALLGITPTVLTKLVDRARAAPKAEAKAAEKAAKAARAEARLREKEAKEKERETKAAEARTRLAAQKTPLPLTNDDDDPLRDWIPPDPDTLPEIIVAGGERPAIADAALAAMKAAGVPFYQRGKDLVRVCLIKLKQSNGKMVRIPAVSTVTKPMLLRAMGLCAKWLALNKELDLVQIDPPSDLGDHILGMIGEWPFPPLRGVIATPTMRYDGTLLTKPGYDAATGLVLFNPPPMPEIPDQPTKQDALEALALLNGLLAEVKFAEDDNVSRAGAISMLMTPVLRGMMSVVPLHIVNKPAPGTGGSYMQDIMAAIAIGEPCPVISLTLNNDEENEKRLSSAATSGQPIIAIDNMVGTLMGQFLCQLVERPMPQIRILGKTELVTIPNNHTPVANGNNVAIAADMVRRTLQISLDADEENPESRTFTRNPVAEVLADRGRYIAAILTIARAYRVAGMPRKLPQRLSFGEWSDNVRSALKWLGWPDCDDSIKTVRAADPAGVQLHAVITAWATDLTVSVGYRTSELIKDAAAFVYDGLGGGARAKPDLWDALFNVAGGKNGQLDARALGRWLEAHLNRVSGGYKLLVDRSDTSRPRWRLEPR